MNRLTYLCGVAMILAIGFYEVQQRSEHSSLVTQKTLAEKEGAPVGIYGSGDPSKHKLPLASTNPGISPSGHHHDLNQVIIPTQPQLSDDDRDLQEKWNAELLASMRANNLPKEHIEHVEKIFAAQREALTSNGSEAPMPAPISVKERHLQFLESIKQAGAPQVVIDNHSSILDTDTMESQLPISNQNLVNQLRQ